MQKKQTIAELSNRLINSSDEDLSSLLEMIDSEPNSELKKAYLTEFYEDALMRDEQVKLPNLLMVSMHEATTDSVKASALLTSKGHCKPLME